MRSSGAISTRSAVTTAASDVRSVSVKAIPNSSYFVLPTSYFAQRAARRALRAVCHCALLLFAEALDAEADDAAGRQIHGRLLPHADAGRGPRGDDVTGLQAHELAEVADQVGHAEDHRARRPVLVPLAVDFEPEVELVPVRHFIGRHEPGADRSERIAALALDPLAAHLELERAFRDVV